MAWKKTWNGSKRETEPNRLSKNPTISFRSNLEPETLGHIKKLSTGRDKSKFINQAIEMKYLYETKKKGFLVQMIQYNFSLCKHILRQIGRVNVVTSKE